MVLTSSHPFVDGVLREARRLYGDRLRALALFGSVARGSARPDSDLDVLLVVEDLPRGHSRRLATFATVETELAREIAALRLEGLQVEISPVLRTPEELAIATPLLLDLTEDAVILEDRGGVLAGALESLRTRLRRLGSRRVWRDGTWYWDRKPDYRRGEIIRL
jgi:uncharacterized protein